VLTKAAWINQGLFSGHVTCQWPGMRRMLIAQAVGLATVCWTSGTAHAQSGPSFPCPSPGDPLGQLVCSNPNLLRADRWYVQAYQALRAQLDPDGQDKLRQDADTFTQRVRTECDIGAPDGGTTTSPTAIPCVRQHMLAQRDLLAERLTGPAAEEAARLPEAHLALQADLKRLGFLPPDVVVDGVFGPPTRKAIQQWQKSRDRNITGFLDYSDGSLLKQQATSLQAQAAGTSPVSSPAAVPPTTAQKPTEQATAPQVANPQSLSPQMAALQQQLKKAHQNISDADLALQAAQNKLERAQQTQRNAKASADEAEHREKVFLTIGAQCLDPHTAEETRQCERDFLKAKFGTEQDFQAALGPALASRYHTLQAATAERASKQAPVPSQASADDPSAQRLDGWEALKFGMTPRQACAAMNKAGLKCTITTPTPTQCAAAVRSDRHYGPAPTCDKPTAMPWPLPTRRSADHRIRIGPTIWDVVIYFANTPENTAKPDAANLDVGSLDRIALVRDVASVDSKLGTSDWRCDRYLGLLEQQYGTFWQDPARLVVRRAVKKFANGARIVASYPSPDLGGGHGCLGEVRITYSAPNTENPRPPPPPPVPSGHF